MRSRRRSRRRVCSTTHSCGELQFGDRIHLRNRDYDPQTGTFLTKDPLGVGAEPEGRPTSANLFVYVGNDPLNNTDPLGLCRTTDVGFSVPVTGSDNATVIGGGSTARTFDQCNNDAGVYCDDLGPYSDPFAEIGSVERAGNTYTCGPDTVSRNLCFPGISDDPNCHSFKEQYPRLYQGLVVVAVVAGSVAVVAAGPQIAAYRAAASAACFTVLNGGGGSAAATWRTDTSHIFRQADGHIATDTPAARALIETAVQPQYLTRVEQSANIRVYHRLLSNGQEVWAKVRDGVTTNGGLNQTPQS